MRGNALLGHAVPLQMFQGKAVRDPDTGRYAESEDDPSHLRYRLVPGPSWEFPTYCRGRSGNGQAVLVATVIGQKGKRPRQIKRRWHNAMAS